MAEFSPSYPSYYKPPPDCPGCGKPTPWDYCWDARDLDCPCGAPPRWVVDGAPGVLGLWRLIVKLAQAAK